MNPIQLFQRWYEQELRQSNVSIPSACCLSTVGLDGYPNARFVSLKEVSEEGFVITGPLNTRKGMEIQNAAKVALTFWWAVSERQVRVQGDAVKIADADADKYFSERPRNAQLISKVSDQGNAITNLELLKQKYQEAATLLQNKKIARPPDWSGYVVHPIRIEFMEFKASRFHERVLFTRTAAGWNKQLLQP
jgi:pyridoxamine 5'-phosphate oxidase